MATHLLEFCVWRPFLIVVLSCLLGPSSAFATSKALVDIDLQHTAGGVGTAQFYTIWTDKVVTVSTSTPDASIMIPSNLLTVEKTITGSGPFTPYVTRIFDFYNKAGTFVPSNTNAPAASTTIVPPSSTTLCTA